MMNLVNLLTENIQQTPWSSKILCSDLLNPRGLIFDRNGDLLLIEAGAGEFKPPFSGQLTVRDSETGVIKKVLLEGYRSLNMQQRMLRDEIMGLADIAPLSSDPNAGWLVTLTDYISGSKLIEVTEQGATTAFDAQGNLNSICYHPINDAWYCIKPDTNQVLEFRRGQPQKVICSLPDLALDQEAVPVNVLYQASSGRLLISLFSGELGRDESLRGIEFRKGDGVIVSVDPNTGDIQTLVTGLTLPTAIALTPEDTLFVTELCDDFLQPLPADHIPAQPLHGGFKRFSGRLLAVNLSERSVKQLFSGLDTPSNIAIKNGDLYLSEGMGLPGRPLPMPVNQETSDDHNHRPLTGFVRKLSAIS